MVQPTTFEVILELALPIAGQFTALLRQMSRERQVILVDDPIEQGLLGPVALVTGSTPVPGGHPGRRRVGHDPRTVEALRFHSALLRLHSGRPCDTVFLHSVSLNFGILKPQS